ncbi:MAG: hypothetical protein KBD37_01785, partial [Burkholderiales bacterium]|nr:hypothetical protein [Burkholderiales bacterium]
MRGNSVGKSVRNFFKSSSSGKQPSQHKQDDPSSMGSGRVMGNIKIESSSKSIPIVAARRSIIIGGASSDEVPKVNKSVPADCPQNRTSGGFDSSLNSKEHVEALNIVNSRSYKGNGIVLQTLDGAPFPHSSQGGKNSYGNSSANSLGTSSPSPNSTQQRSSSGAMGNIQSGSSRDSIKIGGASSADCPQNQVGGFESSLHSLNRDPFVGLSYTNGQGLKVFKSATPQNSLLERRSSSEDSSENNSLDITQSPNMTQQPTEVPAEEDVLPLDINPNTDGQNNEQPITSISSSLDERNSSGNSSENNSLDITQSPNMTQQPTEVPAEEDVLPLDINPNTDGQN